MLEVARAGCQAGIAGGDYLGVGMEKGWVDLPVSCIGACCEIDLVQTV